LQANTTKKSALKFILLSGSANDPWIISKPGICRLKNGIIMVDLILLSNITLNQNLETMNLFLLPEDHRPLLYHLKVPDFSICHRDN